jgi:hypothetical protein
MQKAAYVAAEAKATKSGGPAPEAEETTVQRERLCCTEAGSDSA